MFLRLTEVEHATISGVDKLLDSKTRDKMLSKTTLKPLKMVAMRRLHESHRVIER